jgi:uncharacterized protein YyaL (SSP411 family)
MFAARARRTAPSTDDKILAGWNGLMLRALSEAGMVLGRADYLDAAIQSGEFLTTHLWDGSRLYRAFRGRRSPLVGYLEDYGSVVDALLALHTATLDGRWFQLAQQIAEAMLEQFMDPQTRLLTDTARETEHLVAQPKDRWDNATPSGTSLACLGLLRLWALTGESRYEGVARAELTHIGALLGDNALGFGYLLCALDLYLGPPDEIAIIGDQEDERTRALLDLRREYLPRAVWAWMAPGDPSAESMVPLLANRHRIGDAPTAYVCRGFVCEQPVASADALRDQLGLGTLDR